MDARFERYCLKWSADVAEIKDDGKRMAYFQEHLPHLLLDRDTIHAVLDHMKKGTVWPDLRYTGLFIHEVMLYLDPSRRFSIRLYFHPPHTHTDVHDHTGWGVSGTPFGRLSVIGYNCEGDIETGRVHDMVRVFYHNRQDIVTMPFLLERMVQAAEAGADYVAFGAFFHSTTKPPKNRAEPEILEWWDNLMTVPSVAIGGITVENCPPLVAAGADFLAIVSGVWDYPDGPEAAVRAFNEMFDAVA